MTKFGVLLFLMASGRISGSINVNLVFKLQELFQSDLILIAWNGGNDDELVKKFLKFKSDQIRGFVSVINVQKNLEEYFGEKLLSPYQNALVISEEKTNLIEKLIGVQNFNLMASVIWIYFTNNEFKNVDNLFIPFNARFYIIRKINVYSYEIIDVYQISERSEKILTRFAVWKNGQFEFFLNDSYGRKMDLKGHQFNVAESSVIENKDKYEYLWKLFAGKMNFSVNWKSEDLGHLYPNGTKTGGLKKMEEREIDGGSSTFFYTEERLNYYDFIFPSMILTTKFYVKLDLEFTWTSYIAPFNPFVYLSIFLWIIVSSFIINLIMRFNGYEKMENSIFIVVKALFNQSGTEETASISFRIAYLMPYLLAVLLTEYYCGALSSYLAIKHGNLPFKNLDEIIDDGSYKISVLKNTYYSFYFRTDNGPQAKAIRSKKLLVETDKLSENLEYSFRQLCDNKWVFLYLSSQLTGKQNCEIVEVDKAFQESYVGIMVWKGFPYRDVMTKIMKRLQFGGLVEFKLKNSKKNLEDVEKLKPFSFELVFPIFLLYFSFAILSLIILLCELIRKPRK